MPTGYFSLILHAHLPFVRHPEYPEFLEEDWLYEAITEVYLPLIFIFQRLHESGAKPRVAMNVGGRTFTRTLHATRRKSACTFNQRT
jgi:1,4-alpha-glucan branching enzyme